MIVRNRDSLEQLVAEDIEESKDVIAFNSLEALELECLPRLKTFCSSSYCLLDLPSLEEVVIGNCPRMEISFGKTDTPILQKVQNQKGDEKDHWQDGLSTDEIFQDTADQIVDARKLEIPELLSSSGDIEQKENALSTDPQDAEMNEAIEKSLIQTTEESHSPPTMQDTEELHSSSNGTQEMHDNIEKSLISAAPNVPSCTIIPNTATMYPAPSQALELATAQNTEESYDSYIEAKKMSDTINKLTSPTAQNVPNSTMIPNAAIDLSPFKVPEPMTSSILESNAYSDFKWLVDISKQNLPYLDAGVKRHPQVLDWFNTEQQRLFATLFTEVTRILRTTRRHDLTEDDRNYIRGCCAALEAVGFDASWLSYVNDCIESCGDGDELKRKLEEIEAKASTLKNELAFVEASLISLRDEVRRLDNFLES